VDKEELKARTKDFGLRVMRLVDALPKTTSGRAIANQLIRSGTSVGANYRAACRARSNKEFIAKLGVVLEEADESVFWLELIRDGELLTAKLVESLLSEANELTAIFSATLRTLKSGTNPNSKI
jgi:four helix bundle protein